MALATTTNWEVRTTGAADNGGGFDPVLGALATDYSQQDAAELSLSDGETSAAGSADLISDTGGFTDEMVGNVLYAASGTNTIVGYYQIVSYTDTNTVTLDRAPDDGVGGLTGDAVFKVGGAIDTPQTVIDIGSGIDTIWIKKGDYTAETIVASGINITGYDTTHGDNPTAFANMPTFLTAQLWSGGVISNIACDGGGFNINSAEVKNCYAKNALIGYEGSRGVLIDCVADGCDSGFDIVLSELIRCRATGGAVGYNLVSYQCFYIGCTADTNTYGWYAIGDADGTFFGCIAYSNTGTGFYTTCGKFNNCISYDNDIGFQLVGLSNERAIAIFNCVASSNTNEGFYLGAEILEDPANNIYFDYNCSYNNGTDYKLWGTFSTDANNFETNPLFVNAATGDFRLQSGSPCLNTGIPQSPLRGGEVI